MSTHHILWADDEIDLLKPHLLFLKQRGYDVTTTNNGHDALRLAAAQPFDLIILDENMPGLTGLETLQRLKEQLPETPVIMITKSEEENIMDQAVGSKIADYLIKPVNPNQILLSLKKNIHMPELVTERTATSYREEFSAISDRIARCRTFADWEALYRKLVFWETELASARDTNMDSLLHAQYDDANAAFAKYIRANYETWIADPDAADTPLLSHRVMKRRVLPLIPAAGETRKPLFLIVIDNFRLDQWSAVKPLLAQDAVTLQEELTCSLLPTATQYARNALFSGLIPAEIERLFPELWVDEDSPEGKNLNESPLIRTFFDRYRRRDVTFSYNKINDTAAGERLLRDYSNLEHNDLNVVVFNFVDMLSHARTESRMIRQLAPDDAAYRSLTRSWAEHSPLLPLIRRIISRGHTVLLTTDHGAIRVDRPIKVVGDRNVNTNLRYKLGKNLGYNAKQVYEARRPALLGLPSPNLSTAYIFATGADFFAYPNNYNYYVQHFTDTFQHGGVSLQEMLVPFITITPR